jgi:CelD/BcsL family acetyltransferase involved in cellulose biosynthesis
MMIPTHKVDPIKDPRWASFLQRHPDASIFHTPGWLEALVHTYGYRPFVLTTAAPGEELRDGILLCRIQSWITGPRIVSAPFSDYCQPLVDQPDTLRILLCALRNESEREKARYTEVRPLASEGFCFESDSCFAKSADFYIHRLSLSADLDSIFHTFHKSCIQRRIRRAEREGFDYEEGSSESILKAFYHLLLLTRRRHQLPPQPLAWFRNLVCGLGDRLRIRVVSKEHQPIASILTLVHKKTVVYKYGCSNEKFHNLGAMPYLLWRAIQDAKASGAAEFDFGRSDVNNRGLIVFKDNWGGTRTRLTYYRYPAPSPEAATPRLPTRAAQELLSALPDWCLTTAGRLFYRHIG